VSINTGGEKVYPEEVEAELRQHPSVFDCAVVGVPDERFGERVVALVQPVAGETVVEGDLLAWCRERLATYKAPRRYVAVDSLQRSAAGKVHHKDLRALALELLAADTTDSAD
jgi:acyl-CoA synthetase (AMP-forming)/AMP-acid ligase II